MISGGLTKTRVSKTRNSSVLLLTFQKMAISNLRLRETPGWVSQPTQTMLRFLVRLSMFLIPGMLGQPLRRNNGLRTSMLMTGLVSIGNNLTGRTCLNTVMSLICGLMRTGKIGLTTNKCLSLSTMDPCLSSGNTIPRRTAWTGLVSSELKTGPVIPLGEDSIGRILTIMIAIPGLNLTGLTGPMVNKTSGIRTEIRPLKVSSSGLRTIRMNGLCGSTLTTGLDSHGKSSTGLTLKTTRLPSGNMKTGLTGP